MIVLTLCHKVIDQFPVLFPASCQPLIHTLTAETELYWKSEVYRVMGQGESTAPPGALVQLISFSDTQTVVHLSGRQYANNQLST